MSDWKETLLDIESPSVWGAIDCGDGWRALVETCYTLTANVECASVAQVKEKFGTLRFYVNHDYDKCGLDRCDRIALLLDQIEAIEQVSRRTCEVCGRYGELRSTTRDGSRRSLIRTLCNECHLI